MFTGIVQALGEIKRVIPSAGGCRVFIDSSALDLSGVRIGDSMLVDGVCLTVTEIKDHIFGVDVSQETLNCTRGFVEADQVNLEPALRLGDRLDGHMVTGHVDAVGTVRRFQALGESYLLEIEVEEQLARFIAIKGSVTINGVSLTVNAIDENRFQMNIIPHTLKVTNLGHLIIGQTVNIEVDLIARYVARLLTSARVEK